MSFSLRSMFNKNDPQDVGSFTAAPTPDFSVPPLYINSPQQPSNNMTPSGFPPAPSPFGGPLFRTLGNDDSSGAPLAFDPGQSPFTSPTAPANVALTVADVLPQIPPEIARATSIPQDQPIQISPQILSHALSSGQLAIPLFEVYRVCPGIFQMPVAPDDTRMVRLPAAKLPALISGAMPPSAPQATEAPPSPFGSLFSAPPSTPSAPASPFQSLLQPAPPSSSMADSAPAPMVSTILPPRRDPSQPPASSLPPTPFLDISTAAPTPSSPPVSPFGLMPEAASPFSTPAQPTPIPSLFTSAPESPFATANPTPQTTPPAPAPSPFASFINTEEPKTTVPASLLASVPSVAPSPATGKISGPATASVAALLNGESTEALGFDPAMVPSWISAQFNGGIIAELQEMPSPVLDLGTIVDGITDIGFRNVLNSARRGHSIPISLSHFTPASATTFKIGAAAPNPAIPAPPAMVTPMRVTPAEPTTDPAFPSPLTPTTQPAALANPFTVEPATTAPAASTFKIEPPTPFADATQSPAHAASPFSLPSPPANPIPNPFEAAQPHNSPTPPEPVAPVFKIEPGNPFASIPEAPATFAAPPDPTPAPSFFAETPPPVAAPIPIQPKVDFSTLFGSDSAPPSAQTAAFSEIQPPPEPLTAPPSPPPPSSFSFGAKAFDPFAPSESTPSTPSTGGFSSFDLLGGTPSTPDITTKAAPAPTPPEEKPAPPTPAQFAPAPEPAPQPVAPLKTPRFFIDPEPAAESEPEPTIVPEIPVTLELPEAKPAPTPALAKKTSAWPDIDPIPAPAPAPTPLFQERSIPAQTPPTFDFSSPEKTPLAPAMPTLASAPRGIAPAKTSLGLSAVDRSGEEQLLLRALLDTDEELTLDRVIEMTSALPGIAACALVRGSDVIAGSSTKGSDAKAFRAQAAEVAKSLRTLAPLIGITDAETFTLNTDSRLITLCFPGEVTLALLHDREPTLGLRDKLTLIARQLDSMVSKR